MKKPEVTDYIAYPIFLDEHPIMLVEVSFLKDKPYFNVKLTYHDGTWQELWPSLKTFEKRGASFMSLMADLPKAGNK